MIRSVHASAPGKMLLLGEYAVLEGAPALVMAVDRLASVDLQANTLDRHRVTAPGMAIDGAEFRVDGDGGVQWTDPALRLPLVEDIVRGLVAQKVVPASMLMRRGCDLRLDTSAFYQGDDTGRRKMGFGSSAALTVALASALAVFVGRGSTTANRRIWLEQLLHMHRSFQGGRGSGADIAASLLGGLIDYRLTGSGDALQPEFRSARLPEALLTRFIWTGSPAATGDFLQRLEQWRDRAGAEYRAHMATLCGIANEAAQAAQAARPDCATMLRLAADYTAALQRFADAADLPVFSTELRALSSIARDHGVVFKPCGAGGGDFGMVLSDDAQRMRSAVDAMVEAGFQDVDLPLANSGLQLDYHPL